MNNYISLIEQINTSIQEFNKQLSEAHTIPCLGSVTDGSFMDISKTPWDHQCWPNRDAKGVYFLLGYKEADPNVPALYIGKASLSNIGERLYHHLSAYRKEPKYMFNSESSTPCVVELVTSIDLSTRHNSSLAVALEEFLIKSMRGKVHLMNTVGNTRE